MGLSRIETEILRPNRLRIHCLIINLPRKNSELLKIQLISYNKGPTLKIMTEVQVSKINYILISLKS